jgi:hypothetical protein
LEKLVYLLWEPEGTPIAEVRETLLGEVAPRLLREGARGLTLNLADAGSEIGASVPVRDPEATPAACLSLWLDSLDQRGRFEEPLRKGARRLAGYLVTESVPRDYDRRDWADGERSPGITLVTCFEKPERLGWEEFLRIWHEEHTPLSFEIHPLWRYVRNVVVRTLTPGASPLAGIVEERFRSVEDLTDPARFYGAGDSRQKLGQNVKRVLDHCRSFLDLERTRSFAANEYILRS